VPDLTQNLFFAPLWSWIVALVTIIFFGIWLLRVKKFRLTKVKVIVPAAEFELSREEEKQKHIADPSRSAQQIDAMSGGQAFGNVGNISGGQFIGTQIVNPPPLAAPTPQPKFPIFNIPHHRNPNFTGRVQLLDDLRAALTANQIVAVTQSQAIHGLGGVGKTQLAVEYAYRYASDYDLVWWLRAEIPATLASDYAQLAQPLNLRDKDAQDQRIVIDAVRAHLLRAENWLLIFDNANASDEIRAYLPPSNAGSVIITSRNQAWRGVANSLPIREMPRADAVNFLFKRTGADVIASRPERVEGSLLAMTDAAEKLADELGNLPLALEQAGAFIEASKESFEKYLGIFKTHRAQLLGKHPPADYAATVATTWEISFGAVEKESLAAAQLLNLLAFFAPDDIPMDVIAKSVGATLVVAPNAAEGRGQAPPLQVRVPAELSAAFADALKFDETVIAPLLRYSLIERRGAEFSIHRLVQAVIRERLTDDEKKKCAGAATQIVGDAFPSGDITSAPETWQQCAGLFPHALATAGYAAALNESPEASAYLFNQAGLYLKVRAQFAESRQLYERALGSYEMALGPNHSNVAAAVNNLGGVLKDLGDLADARKHYERALAIGESNFGANHSQVAIGVNNLGLVLRSLGDLDGARKHFERALKIDEASFGPNHPNVARDVNNLGSVLGALGDLAGASKHFEHAIGIWEKSLGSEHPQVASGVNNLGGVLQALGDFDGARKNFERALKIRETVFGPNHPDVAISIWWLGTLAQLSGDVINARKHFERALKIFTEFLGKNHPNTVTVQENLEMLKAKSKK